MSSLELASPLSPVECADRLGGVVGSAYGGLTPVFGQVRGWSFWLERRISYRNSFKTRLRAQMTEVEGGTRIRCSTGMQPLVVAFMLVWATIVAIGMVMVLGTNPAVAGVPLGMLCFGAGIVGVGRYLARDEEAQLLRLLHERLEAREVGSKG